MAGFNISLNGKHLFTKRAWNSSIRAIEHHVGAHARKVGQDFHLTKSESYKNEAGFVHSHGRRVWQSDKETLDFVIQEEMNEATSVRVE